MTPKQVQLVQDTFAQVAPMADVAAELFYSKLFLLDPALRTLFKTDMREQGKKLMQTLSVVVGNLHKLDTMLGAVEALGQRHVAYRVKPADYDTVGQALLATLAEGLGEAFTPEVKEAWGEAYTLLASVMIKAAEQVHLAA